MIEVRYIEKVEKRTVLSEQDEQTVRDYMLENDDASLETVVEHLYCEGLIDFENYSTEDIDLDFEEVTSVSE